MYVCIQNKTLKTVSKLFFLFSIIFTSCGAVGTKTIYRTETSIEKPLRIGFSQLADVETMGKIVKGCSEIYDRTMIDLLNNQNISSNKITISEFNSFEDISIENVKNICIENKIEGLILTKLKFINVSYSSMFIPLGVSEDTEVEMLYYQADGRLLFHTLHNTHKGNSYWNFVPAERTVTDGTTGAFNRIVKEFKKTKHYENK